MYDIKIFHTGFQRETYPPCRSVYNFHSYMYVYMYTLAQQISRLVSIQIETYSRCRQHDRRCSVSFLLIEAVLFKCKIVYFVFVNFGFWWVLYLSCFVSYVLDRLRMKIYSNWKPFLTWSIRGVEYLEGDLQRDFEKETGKRIWKGSLENGGKPGGRSFFVIWRHFVLLITRFNFNGYVFG